jgi:hypothetical protein
MLFYKEAHQNSNLMEVKPKLWNMTRFQIEVCQFVCALQGNGRFLTLHALGLMTCSTNIC